MLSRTLLVLCGAGILGGAILFLFARAREASEADRLIAALSQSAPLRPGASSGVPGGALSASPVAAVDSSSFHELPAPVARYFRLVLTDGQRRIRSARFRQSGELRTSTSSDTWSPFTADQLVVPPARGFVWNARIGMPVGHVRVLDRYVAGEGAGRVSLLSALRLGADAGAPELNEGALHRYLAEAVWYPTALLPGAGVVWSAIDDRTASATLTDRGTTVSLEFRFGDAGEVTGIYSPGRFAKTGDGYARKAWEGHFRDYETRQGMRVPLYGEVGWYDDGVLGLVWKGNVIDAEYEFE